MITELLFRCVGCGARPDAARFPYCAECVERWVPCPQVCLQCLSPACNPGNCKRPWLFREAAESAIATIGARYLLIGPGYLSLRRWKWHGGPAQDRRVLNADGGSLPDWRALGIGAVVPVPQRFARSWKLGGSPAERVARWAATRAGAPVVRALMAARRARQARLGLADRLRASLRMPLAQGAAMIRGQKVLLVDDFLTTGRTLRTAAHALHAAGASEVHAFCLGVRPPRSSERTAPRPAASPEARAGSPLPPGEPEWGRAHGTDRSRP